MKDAEVRKSIMDHISEHPYISAGLAFVLVSVGVGVGMYFYNSSEKKDK